MLAVMRMIMGMPLMMIMIKMVIVTSTMMVIVGPERVLTGTRMETALIAMSFTNTTAMEISSTSELTDLSTRTPMMGNS